KSSPACSAFCRSSGASDTARSATDTASFMLLQRKFETRHLAQDGAHGGRDRRRAGQMADRILISSGGLTQGSGMDGEFEGMRIEFAGSPGIKYRPVELPGSGKRPADMAVTLRPSWSDLQQSLICRGGVFVPSAIAEDPGTEVWRCLHPQAA